MTQQGYEAFFFFKQLKDLIWLWDLICYMFSKGRIKSNGQRCKMQTSVGLEQFNTEHSTEQRAACHWQQSNRDCSQISFRIFLLGKTIGVDTSEASDLKLCSFMSYVFTLSCSQSRMRRLRRESAHLCWPPQLMQELRAIKQV